MEFLIDRCAGRLIAQWLRSNGHDVVESRERGPDPGDRVLLEWAANESRILVTIDTDFGQLLFQENAPHCGLIRLPDVPAKERLLLIEDLLVRFPRNSKNPPSSQCAVVESEYPSRLNSLQGSSMKSSYEQEPLFSSVLRYRWFVFNAHHRYRNSGGPGKLLTDLRNPTSAASRLDSVALESAV